MFEYMVLSAETPKELERKVCKYINQGWQAQGGLSTNTIWFDKRVSESGTPAYAAGVTRYHQAIAFNRQPSIIADVLFQEVSDGKDRMAK